MSENTPTSAPDAVPPKPAEASKVQPKKETVRITLPPKLASAPSIKIPAPPQAPSSASAPSVPQHAAPEPSHAARPMQAAAPARPAPAPSAPKAFAQKPVAASVSGLDKGLAVAAVIVSLLVVGFLMTL